MTGVYNKLKMMITNIIKFFKSEKSKLISVSINIVGLFILLVVTTFARNSFQLVDHDGIELISSGILDLIIITVEALLCFQIGSYVFNKSEKICRHIPYAIIISVVVNLLIELYKMIKLIDIKISISEMSATSHTLTTANIHIILVILILIFDLSLGIYTYRRFFTNQVIKSKRQEKKEAPSEEI